MIGSLYDPENKAKPVAFDDEVLKNTGGEVSGIIKNTNKTSFAVIQKERETNEKVYLVSVGSGLDQDLVSGAIEVAETTGDSYNIVARVDVGQKGVIYRGVNKKSGSLFGEHNKPSGTYAGTGETSRTINIGGIGNILILYNNTSSLIGFVTQYGMYVIQDDSCGYVKTAKYKDGLLTINGTAEINDEGKTISYQVI